MCQNSLLIWTFVFGLLIPKLREIMAGKPFKIMRELAPCKANVRIENLMSWLTMKMSKGAMSW